MKADMTGGTPAAPNGARITYPPDKALRQRKPCEEWKVAMLFAPGQRNLPPGVQAGRLSCVVSCKRLPSTLPERIAGTPIVPVVFQKVSSTPPVG
jgi:hypothetical protein